MAQIVQICVLIVVPIETYKQSLYVKQGNMLSREPFKFLNAFVLPTKINKYR